MDRVVMEDQFQVGDRVQGKMSGLNGVITEALGNNRYRGVIDGDGPVNWTRVDGRNLRLIEPADIAEPAPAKAEFEVGDIVRHKRNVDGRKYDVLGVRGGDLWLKATTHASPAYTGVASLYETVKPFFEAGQAYRRETAWSILFQTASTIEHFKVERVDYNQHGKPIAYGRLYLPGLETKHGWRWMTKSQFQFNTEKWERL